MAYISPEAQAYQAAKKPPKVDAKAAIKAQQDQNRAMQNALTNSQRLAALYNIQNELLYENNPETGQAEKRHVKGASNLFGLTKEVPYATSSKAENSQVAAIQSVVSKLQSKKNLTDSERAMLELGRLKILEYKNGRNTLAKGESKELKDLRKKIDDANKDTAQAHTPNKVGDGPGPQTIMYAAAGKSLDTVVDKERKKIETKVAVSPKGTVKEYTMMGVPETIDYFAKEISKDPTKAGQIQNLMWQAGYYGDQMPVPGYVGEEDIAAFKSAVVGAAMTGQNIEEYLNQRATAGLEAKRRKVAESSPFQVSSQSELRKSYRDAYISSFGYAPPDGQLDSFIGTIHGKQVNAQAADVAARSQSQSTIYGPDPNTPQGTTIIEQVNPEADAIEMARKTDPTGVQAHDYATRAMDIFQMINSPFGGTQATRLG